MKNSAKQLLFTVFFMATAPFATHAFYSVQDTGELLKPEEVQISAELQFVTNMDEGTNIIARFDKGFNDESNFRLIAGTGTTDFVLGGSYKWVPVPDIEGQPAIGFHFGAIYARWEQENELSLRAVPFLSKKFDTDIGVITPYGALPIGLRNYNEETDVPLNLALGARYAHPDFEHCDFTAEIGMDLNDSFSYVSVGAVFPAF